MSVIWIILGLLLVYIVAKNNPNLGEELSKVLKNLIDGFKKYAEDKEIKLLLPSLILAIENANKDNKWDFMEIVSVVTLIIKIQQRIAWIDSQSPQPPPPPPPPPEPLKDKILFEVEKSEDLPAVKELGFNTVQVYTMLYMNDNAVKEYLDKCNGLGLKCMISLAPSFDDSLPEKRAKDFVKMWKDHPAVYSWYTLDEPVTRKVSIEKQIEVYDLVRSWDNHTPVSICISARNDPHFYDEYFTDKAYDILLSNCYPLCKWNTFGDDLVGLRKYFWRAVEHVKFLDDKAIPVLQVHYDDGTLRNPIGTIKNQYKVWSEGEIKGSVAMFAFEWTGGIGLKENKKLREEVKKFLK